MQPLSAITPPDLADYLPLIELARNEDLGDDGGDITSQATIPPETAGIGELICRQGGILSGMAIVPAILNSYDPQLKLQKASPDSCAVSAGAAIGTVDGPLRTMLAAERVVLNFLQHLSGIATETGRYVAATGGTKAKICDTRKTTPAYRSLEKYAVRCGGGHNHRAGLYDAVLIKDNHIAAMACTDIGSGIRKAIENIRQTGRQVSFIEVEVDTLEQLDAILPIAGVDIILLDNMSPEQLRKAVSMRDRQGRPDVELEASGGITLNNVPQIARTGIDRISIGAITHSVSSMDIGFDLRCR